MKKQIYNWARKRRNPEKPLPPLYQRIILWLIIIAFIAYAIYINTPAS